MIHWWSVAAGLAILLIVLWDVFVTVFSTLGAGPLTSLWMRTSWRGLLWLHHRRRVHRLLALAGPLMLVAAIVSWHLLLALGWYLLFAADPSAVVEQRTGVAVDGLGRAYFIAATVSGLGYGDVTAAVVPWTLLSGVAAIAATIVLTTSLSYVLAVVGAGIARKSLAEEIFAYGDDAALLVRRFWLRGSRSFAETYVQGVLTRTRRHTHDHLSYPVLHFFHSALPNQSVPRAMLLLGDAWFVLASALPEDQRPGENVLAGIRQHIDRFAAVTATGLVRDPPASAVRTSHLEPAALRAAGLEPVADAAVGVALDAYRPLRARLLALCDESGWPLDDRADGFDVAR